MATLDGKSQPVINTRDLHERLGVKTAYKDWIKRRIKERKYTEGKEFVLVLLKSERNPKGSRKSGRPTKDYLFTLRAAKELAASDDSEMGRVILGALLDLQEAVERGDSRSCERKRKPMRDGGRGRLTLVRKASRLIAEAPRRPGGSVPVEDGSMTRRAMVLVPCTISRGNFPSERAFEVTVPNRGSLAGLAPVGYCFGVDGQPVPQDGHPTGEHSGFVAGVVVGRNPQDAQLARVYLPDGEVYELDEAMLTTAKEVARVPVQS